MLAPYRPGRCPWPMVVFVVVKQKHTQLAFLSYILLNLFTYLCTLYRLSLVRRCWQIHDIKVFQHKRNVSPKLACRDENWRHFALSPTCRRHCQPSKTMGAARPVGRIRCRRRHVCHLMVSGDKGGHGGGVRRVRGGRYRSTNHRVVRVTGFFSTTRCACLHT